MNSFILRLADLASNDHAFVEAQDVALHLADTLIAAITGYQLPESKRILEINGSKYPNAIDLMRLAASIRMTEIDDIHMSTGVTASSIVVPAILSCLSETDDRSSSGILDSLFVGYQITLRLARSFGGAKLMLKGLWPSYLVAAVGSAVSVGRMLQLDQMKMAHAIALALAQTPRSIGKSSGDWPGRWFLFGQAVLRGKQCAYAAEKDIQGDLDLLTPQWIESIGGEYSNIEYLDKPIGVNSISFKPFCAAKQTISAICAMRSLTDTGLNINEIKRVHVFVPKAYYEMIDRESYQASRLASIVNVKWQLALSVFSSNELTNIDRQIWSDCPERDSFLNKIFVVYDSCLDRYYPEKWPAKLAVEFEDHVIQTTIISSDGDFDNGIWTSQHILNKASQFCLNQKQLNIIKQIMIDFNDDFSIKNFLGELKEDLTC
jgi:2-methylcitrate dehydratase PrpD